MPLIELTNANFDDETECHNLAILDFWAPWCAPCKAFAPIFEAAAEKNQDILFARINTEDEPTLAKQFEVQSIPTILAAKDGIIVQVCLGAIPPAKLDRMIEDLRKP
jgi:thioredoxin 1